MVADATGPTRPAVVWRVREALSIIDFPEAVILNDWHLHNCCHRTARGRDRRQPAGASHVTVAPCCTCRLGTQVEMWPLTLMEATAEDGATCSTRHDIQHTAAELEAFDQFWRRRWRLGR